jgi:hypothetical protein
MNKEEIIEFLKNNLEINIFEDQKFICDGYCDIITIELKLNNEIISSDSISITK